MDKSRKQVLAQIILDAELAKFAQEVLDNAPESDQAGQQIAEQVFDKFLSELDIDSL